MRSFRLALALVASTCLACVHKPEMHLDHCEISGVQLATMPPTLGIVMVVVINVYNPNGYDVAVRGVRGQAILADQYPLPVTFQAPPDGLWMPAGQTTPVRVPITVPIQLAIALVQQGMASPTIPYRFTGSADVTASHTFQIEKDNYSVDETGTITRDQMMSVIPPNPFMTMQQFLPH
jgi:late embryogenesis abundant protein